MPPTNQLVRSIELLRLAEARLARRRVVQSGLGDTDRAALRYVLECCRDGIDVTPGGIAVQLELSPASVTSLIDRLVAAGMLRLTPNPKDRRSKLVHPVDPDLNPDEIDPLTTRIRAVAEELTGRDADVVAAFIDRVAEIVRQTSPGSDDAPEPAAVSRAGSRL